MCSTCDYTKYESVDGRLQQPLGMGDLLISCNPNGKNYKLSIKDEPKSSFVIYWCPTCGHALF